MSFALLTLDFGREQVAIEPRHVMAFHPFWVQNPESPEDPKAGRNEQAGALPDLCDLTASLIS